MTDIVCALDPSQLPKAAQGTIPILLYGARSQVPGGRAIGGPLLAEVRRLGLVVPAIAFDFLTLALAVTAADTFVQRAEAADGWCRELHLVVPVTDPGLWTPVIEGLQNLLRFLSGDMWSLDIRSGGRPPPTPQSRGKLIELADHDCACLFSGGLDSTIGALDLAARGRRPVLVSHSYSGDKTRQESIWQTVLGESSRFAANAHPNLAKAKAKMSAKANDTTMRTRSLNFLAYGVVVGSTLAAIANTPSITLFVPENGWIALNPPLTSRRIGALSTRTTHPYFLGLVQQVFCQVGIPITIENPYRFRTKGEMVRDCLDAESLDLVIDKTVSCGKWKRSWKQCGRCVPCLIRRAAICAAAKTDETPYLYDDLSSVMEYEGERDDLLAMLIALKKAETTPLENWAALSGPMPTSRAERDMQVDVFRRGLAEMRGYLHGLGLI